jgi:hypothetical protein
VDGTTCTISSPVDHGIYTYKENKCEITSCEYLHKLETNGKCVPNFNGKFKIKNVFSNDYIALCGDGSNWTHAGDTRSCYKRSNTADQSNVWEFSSIKGEKNSYEIENDTSGGNVILRDLGDGEFGNMLHWDKCGKNDAQYKNGQCKWEIKEISDDPGKYEIINKYSKKNVILRGNGTTFEAVSHWDKCGKNDAQYKNGQCKWTFEKYDD